MNKQITLYSVAVFGIGIVRFENSICTGADSLDGTCYTRRQCNTLPNGISSGSCASGIGVCCVGRKCAFKEDVCCKLLMYNYFTVVITCGNTTYSNNTYFVNPNFPNSYAGGSSCTITIKKCNPDICQVSTKLSNETKDMLYTDEQSALQSYWSKNHFPNLVCNFVLWAQNVNYLHLRYWYTNIIGSRVVRKFFVLFSYKWLRLWKQFWK